VARHFFGVADVKRCIDLAAMYKMNRFHLHLTDDQGWRIQIDSWPELARKGGSTAVNHDPGGYYTKADYAEIVDYAAHRFVTIVPEIDMPAHCNAALACYPELNKDGVAPDLYTGIEVGFCTFEADKEITYQFIDDVIGELAAMTPGPYIHIGGDEAHSTPPEVYPGFIERVQQIVEKHGKQMVGWEEIGRVQLLPSSIAQAWKDNSVLKAVEQGAKAILSPAYLAYLDMQYDDTCPLGLSWAGFVEVDASYSWEPGELIEGLAEESILGVEACLWSETLLTMADIEYMAFPRLPGLAEKGWSPAGQDWEEYRLRLAAHAARLAALGIHFYHSPVVDW
jgi:hexosaminidase